VFLESGAGMKRDDVELSIESVTNEVSDVVSGFWMISGDVSEVFQLFLVQFCLCEIFL
jgi:hypothetical protein